MIKHTAFGEVSQYLMGKEIDGNVLYSMAIYYVDGLLIDSGPFSVTTEASRLFQKIPIKKVVNTHHHEDHIGNNYLLQEQGLPIWAHELAVPLIKDPSTWTPRWLNYQRLVWELPPASDCQPLEEYIRSDRYKFRIIHTPGHSADHICLLEEEMGWLFGGDLFLGEKVKMLRSDEDVHMSMASLEQLLNYDFDTIFCSSGRVFDNAREKVRRKLNWWRDLYRQADKMAGQGFDAPAICDKLLGEENMFFQVTEGDMCKLNLIKSFLSQAGKQQHYPEVSDPC
jgi:glyoxylase-like metal-dependent hydrolase (beta-lactamase superfamily II)